LDIPSAALGQYHWHRGTGYFKVTSFSVRPPALLLSSWDGNQRACHASSPWGHKFPSRLFRPGTRSQSPLSPAELLDVFLGNLKLLLPPEGRVTIQYSGNFGHFPRQTPGSMARLLASNRPEGLNGLGQLQVPAGQLCTRKSVTSDRFSQKGVNGQ
jgi:hypothetical protein